MCCTLLCVHSSFAIILIGKRELVALLVCLPVSRDCYVALPLGATRVSAVCGMVFSDHTHILFTSLFICFIVVY